MPNVSVIIPVYNRSELLKEAVQSVLDQTYRDFELIVVDDGSDSEEMALTTDICERAGARLIRLTHFGCPGRARNRGVEQASGRWIAFLDSDDIWCPEKLQKQVDYLNENKGCALVHTREVWKREGRIVSQRKQRHNRCGDIYEDALVKCIIGPSTVMIDRSVYDLLGGFNDHIEIAEDYEFWLRFTAKYKCGYLEYPLVIKRAGTWDQLSEKYGQIEIFRIRALRIFLDYNDLSETQRELAIFEYVRKCLIFANGCDKRGRKVEASFWEKEASFWEEKQSQSVKNESAFV